MIKKIEKFDEVAFDDEDLKRFFGVVAQRNNKRSFDPEVRKRIESYMMYKANYDRNQFLDSQSARNILMKLGEDVVVRLYCEFIYRDFLKLF